MLSCIHKSGRIRHKLQFSHHIKYFFFHFADKTSVILVFPFYGRNSMSNALKHFLRRFYNIPFIIFLKITFLQYHNSVWRKINLCFHIAPSLSLKNHLLINNTQKLITKLLQNTNFLKQHSYGRQHLSYSTNHCHCQENNTICCVYTQGKIRYIVKLNLQYRG